jgi:hypothetical protein
MDGRSKLRIVRRVGRAKADGGAEKAAKRLRSKGIDGIEIFGRAVTGSGEGAETEGDVEGWQSRVACQTPGSRICDLPLAHRAS